MIFCTSGWRTTSALVNLQNAMPRTSAQHALRLDEAALLAAREVDLRDVAGDDRLAREADAREEHLHLLGRGVLRLVEDDEAVVQRASAHVGERRELDRLALEELRRLVEAHQVVHGVVQRPQVRVDLLREVARQESQALARLDRRAHQHDALDRVALQRVDGAGHREVRLAGAGRTDAERDVVRGDRLEVRHLVGRAAVQVGAPRVQHRRAVLGFVASRNASGECSSAEGPPAVTTRALAPLRGAAREARSGGRHSDRVRARPRPGRAGCPPPTAAPRASA